jgi:hypothetical protein
MVFLAAVHHASPRSCLVVIRHPYDTVTVQNQQRYRNNKSPSFDSQCTPAETTSRRHHQPTRSTMMKSTAAALSSAATTTEEWTIVTRNDKHHVSRRRGRHQRKSVASGETQHHNYKNTNMQHDTTEDLLMIPDVIVPQLEQCILLLQSSDFYQNLKTLLFHPPENDVIVFRRIVCYGLGSVMTKSTTVMSASLWQLALLKCIDKDFGMATSPSSPPSSSSLYKQIVFYDPCTLPMEHELLYQFFPEITILPTNHRGKIRLIEDNDKEIGDDDGMVLFYMPHCPMLLYEHVLWSHWEEFVEGKVMLLGNSLHAYAIQRTIIPPLPQATPQQHSKSKQSSAVTSSSSLPPCLTAIVGLSSSSSRSTTSSTRVVTEQVVGYTRDDVTNLPGHFERAFNDLYLIRCNGAMLDSDSASIPRPPEPVMDSTNEMDERELL